MGEPIRTRSLIRDIGTRAGQDFLPTFSIMKITHGNRTESFTFASAGLSDRSGSREVNSIEAFRIDCDPLFILDQLFHLDSATMMIRQNGVGFTMETQFGVFSRDSTNQTSIDAVSGLSIRSNEVSGWIHPTSDRRRLAVSFITDRGDRLSIFPGGGLTNQLWWEKLSGHLPLEAVDLENLPGELLSDWLDDWGPVPQNLHPGLSRKHLHSILLISRFLVPTIECCGWSISPRMEPSVCDFETDEVRLCDSSSMRSLYLDLNHRSISLIPDFETFYLQISNS